MKRLRFIGIFILLCLNISAQTIEDNSEIRKYLDNLFSEMELERVTTGLLYDYSVNFVDFELLDGTELTDENYVNVSAFKNILYAINSSAVSSEPIAELTSIFEGFRTPKVSNTLNLGVAFFEYDYIKDEAVSAGLIGYDAVEEKYYDVYQNGTWVNPYATAYILGFSPSSNICQNEIVYFNFSTSYLFTNKSAAIASLYFDPGDGNGYRELNTSTSSFSASYSSEGVKELKLIVRLSSGAEYHAHSLIYILPRQAKLQQVSGNTTYSSSLPKKFNGTNGAYALANVYLAPGNSEITKPFIYIEGFDTWMLDSENERTRENGVVLGNTNHKTFASFWKSSSMSAFNSVYDLIYIDLGNPLIDIRYNAELLTEIIRQINTIKASAGSQDHNILMGYSMGGLIGRVALREMELSGIAHETSAFISHDAPHLGANIPIGYLQLIHQLYQLYYGDTESIESLLDLAEIEADVDHGISSVLKVLHSPAVHQMLAYHVDTGCLSASGSVAHTEWQNYLDNIGFPQGHNNCPTENYAIVNGAVYDYVSTWYNRKYLFYAQGKISTSFILNAAVRENNLRQNVIMPEIMSDFFDGIIGTDLNLNIQVMPDSRYNPYAFTSRFEISYTKKMVVENITKPYFLDIKSNLVNNQMFYDDAPGSIIYNDTTSLQYSTCKLHSLTKWLKVVLATIDLQADCASAFTFIPTASALANGTDDTDTWLRNYYLSPPKPTIETPFNSYYLSDVALEHGYYENSAWYDWLQNQLNMEITGCDSYIDELVDLDVTGLSNGATATLSVDNICNTYSTYVGIAANGNLNAYLPCSFDVIAQSYTNGQMLYKKKRVIYLYPAMYLTSEYIPGEGYVVTAHTLASEDKDLLSQLVNEGKFTYEWGYKEDTEAVQWVQSKSNKFIAGLPDGSTNVTVFLRMVDYDGRNDSAYSIPISTNVPFKMNYKYVVINSKDEIYLVTDSGYELYTGTQQLGVSLSGVPLEPNANILSTNYHETYFGGNDCYLLLQDNKYIKGQKETSSWKFDYFNSDYFISCFDTLLENISGEDEIVQDASFILCNSRQEKMQTVPFTIMYKPNFPNN